MDLEEVKVIIRSLITSSQVKCHMHHLLQDYRKETGSDLPLFGYRTPIDFLRSIPDTIKLSAGNNPEIFLVESDKSSHVSSLVEGQRRNPKLNNIRTRVVLSQDGEDKDSPIQNQNIPRPILSANAKNHPTSNPIFPKPPPAPSLMSVNVQPPSLMSVNVQPAQIRQPAFNVTKLMQEVQRNPPVMAPYCNNYVTNPYYNNVNNPVAQSAVLAQTLINANLFYNALMQSVQSVQNAQMQNFQNVHNAQRVWGGSNFAASNNNFASSHSSKSTYNSSKTTTSAPVSSPSPVVKTSTSSKDCELEENKHVFISRFEREKIRKFLQDRPKGASISEILGIFAINPSNKGFIKKLPSISDIVKYCSDFSELIDNRLYYKEPSVTTVEKKEEAVEKPVPTSEEEKPVTTTKITLRPVTKCNTENYLTSAVEETKAAPKEEVQEEREEVRVKEEYVSAQTKEEQAQLKEERKGKDIDFIAAVEKNNKAPMMDTSGDDSNIKSFTPFKSTVNDRVQKKLCEVMKHFPNGLWCCDLPEKYFEIHKSVLDFKDFGYTSLIQMVLELPDIFRCYQPGMGDWFLFDATSSISMEEAKYREMDQSTKVPNYIKTDLLRLLESNDVGIFLEDIAPSYFKKYKRKLEYTYLGFTNIKDFISSLEGDIIRTTKLDKRLLVIPLERKTEVTDPLGNVKESAIPPIVPGEAFFLELFPEEVFGPNEKLPKIELKNYLEVGSIIEIVVGDVYTPYRFFVLLKEYQDRCGDMMREMEEYYSSNLNRYHMPNVTIQPKQICAAYYDDPEMEDKWHRAEIVRVVNENRFVVNLVDYGTVTRVTKDQLRFLLREFGELPVQATLTRLNGIKPPYGEEEWSEATNKRFLELASSPSMYIEVLDIEHEVRVEIDGLLSKVPRLTVKLSEYKEEQMVDVEESLIKEGLAISIDDFESASKVEILPKKTKGGLAAISPKKLTVIEEERPPQQQKKQAECSVGVVQPSIRSSKPPVLAEPRNIVPPQNIPQKSPVSPNPFGNQPNEEVFQYRSGVRTSVSTISSSSQNTGATRKITSSRRYVSSESTFSAKASMPSNPTMPPLTPKPASESSTTTNFSVPPFLNIPTSPVSPSVPPGFAPSAISPVASSAPPGFTPSFSSSNVPLCAVPPTAAPPKTNIDVLTQYMQLVQTQMELQERQMELIREKEKKEMEEKKTIANLAIYFLRTNNDLSAIAQADPQMALRVATSLAEGFYNSTKSTSILQTATATANAASTLSTASITSQIASATASAAAAFSTANTTATASVSQDVDEAKFYEKEVDVLTTKMLPLNITSPPAQEPEPFRRYIKEEKVENHNLHVFNIDDEPYVCVDQILRLYTPLSSRITADKILASKKLTFNYKIMIRSESRALFEELESYNSLMCGEADEDYLFLLPLKNATQFLNSFKKITTSILYAFIELLENFNPRDNYWTVP